MWIDNHCHLDDESLRSGVLLDARSAGVVGMVCVGTDLGSSMAALHIARSNDGIWSTAGLHPHDAKVGIDGLEEFIAGTLGRGDPLVAVGECGLDFHYNHSPKEVQRKVFAEQIRLAHDFDLPLVIHTRSAWDETFEILDSETMPTRTVFHCFSGGPTEAEACLERGALLSMSGIITFPSADDIRSAVAITPIERLMVETDSPYLAPVPHRGRPNTPAYVPLVGAAVADVLGIPVDDVADVTTATTRWFYGLDRFGVQGRT